jgi:hypothetical protein
MTVDCFNFIANKGRDWRSFVIRILNYFNLTTKSYTLHQTVHDGLTCDYSNGHDIAYFGNDDSVKKFFAWVNSADRFNGLPVHFFSCAAQYGDAITPWNQFLKNQVFGPSAVAIIMEPLETGWINHSTFSEKTIYSMLGLNFPLWPLGMRQAEIWSSMGFDVFDDVIDHTYQYIADPQERCFYAIRNNLEILTNLELAKKLRNQHAGRLLANQQLIYSGQLKKWLKEKIIYGCDLEIQEHVKSINEESVTGWNQLA